MAQNAAPFISEAITGGVNKLFDLPLDSAVCDKAKEDLQ
jgi:hypothetical protein